MLPWLLLTALAHNGEDHSAPPPDQAAAEGARVPTWSSEFEAVLAPGDADVGAPTTGTLWVANYRTSAPEPAGKATIQLHGPGELAFEAAATATPGAWAFTTTFPAAGPWSGDLMILTPGRSDALGLPAFTLPTDEHDDHDHDGWTTPALLGAGAAGLLLGLALARLGRRGAVPSALLGLLIVGRGWAHGDDEAPAPASHGELRLTMDSQFLLELRTVVAGPAPFAEAVRAAGTTRAAPDGAADLRAPVFGRLAWPRPVAPGDPIQAGDLVATITEALGSVDRASAADALQAARVRLAEAKEAAALAERDAAKAPDLGAALSDRDRLAREQAALAAREGLRAATEAYDALSGPVTPLRAPLSGRVSAVLAPAGALVSPADSVLRITADAGLWVDVAVPETWAGRLRSGDAATLYADADPRAPLAAHVLDPGLEADPASGSLRVKLALDAPTPGLVPGMSVTASITVGAPRHALVVPDAAIVDSAGETLVFVKTAPERFEARRVRTGARSGDARELLSGVEPGERVVVQATYALRSLAGR